MKQLIEISDESLGLPKLEGVQYNYREAARGIIFNTESKIALLRVGKHNYYKLPGGGIQEGETWQQGLQREATEEVGVEVSVRDIEIGQSLEWRGEHELHHVSFCGVADVVKDLGVLNRDDYEVDDDQLPLWVTLEEAIDLIKASKPTHYMGKFIVVRDLAFLEEAQRILPQ